MNKGRNEHKPDGGIMTTKKIDAEVQACDLKAHYRPVALKAVVAAHCIRPKIVDRASHEDEPHRFDPGFHGYPELES